MEIDSPTFAGSLRRDIADRNRAYAATRRHVESYGSEPVVVYEPDARGHGNFFAPAYAAITGRAEWVKRFSKVHTGWKDLPAAESGRKWRELDSCMSSDALLMNVFCTPGVVESRAVRSLLGIEAADPPIFGWKARIPLRSGLADRTEVDMRWGDLLVEAKLTETDFQTRKAELLESYRDFDAVFDRDELPQIEILTGRRKQAPEFAESFSQEWEDTGGLSAEETSRVAQAYQRELVAQAEVHAPREIRYRGYQLIRNVLAAQAAGCRFCVMHDERRPDLREAWFNVMKAVRSADLRTRCAVLTWQELAGALPSDLQEFLREKYGIGAG